MLKVRGGCYNYRFKLKVILGSLVIYTSLAFGLVLEFEMSFQQQQQHSVAFKNLLINEGTWEVTGTYLFYLRS